MSRENRKRLIEEIEALRGTRVLAYVTGDRAPYPAKMDEDALLPLVEHLRAFGKPPKIDLFLFSRGGGVDVPSRVVSALRTTTPAWDVLVPFRAGSGATLVALGADSIVMGRWGELGPIDPQIMLKPQAGAEPSPRDAVGVEDVMAFLDFAKKHCTPADSPLSELVKRIDAAQLGNMCRVRAHIRDIAQRILRSRAHPAKEEAMGRIVDALAEERYTHGHAIALAEAREIGLPAEPADDRLEPLMWQLYKEYEGDLKLREPYDWMEIAIRNPRMDRHHEKVVTSMIETKDAVDHLAGTIDVAVKRLMPGTVNIASFAPMLRLERPPGQPGAMGPPVPMEMYPSMSPQMQIELVRFANQAVWDALHAQCPIAGIETQLRGARWCRAG